ncbi:MAG: ATP-dependent Clp protease adaptor ClpS [Armatimonadetes bacterium]|nr:ATP-dependent Clp protease adaptor ClpS [Armatimonadota bacterium]MBS1728977.1 ATP-dependent Clp protease adaptor ClpS [Armatimonadota bacterium]
MGRLILNSTETIERPDLAGNESVENESWMVIVYNNEFNTYEEVVMILLVATHCTLEEAEIETWEIDHLGKSNVHFADKEECETVARIIRQIGIEVEVKAE